jgi:hypothetical protein
MRYGKPEHKLLGKKIDFVKDDLPKMLSTTQDMGRKRIVSICGTSSDNNDPPKA